ncbi:MAG: DUF5011 domain-containing protein [Bacilli bacterium]|nr:DUF5011 domain-containing protein [Bacilli bacterium]
MIESNINKEDEKKKKIFNKKPILIIIAFSIPFLCFLIYIFLSPNLSLIGESDIKIEYGKNYLEKGYIATYLGQDITNKVWIEGNVDNNKIGKYKLTYKVKKNNITVKRSRNITIVDQEKPVINLVGNQEIKLCPSAKFVEPGYSASDNYDGDLTENVVVKTNEDEVIYEVSDSSNNKTSVKRKIEIDDTDSPILKLEKGTDYYILLGNNYIEPGYNAFDNCDGNLTNNVVITGTVDTSKIGNYQILYEVADSKGNKSSVTRNVFVIKEDVPIKGAIYLTFDDGPSSSITPQILEILKEKDVKATFFVINKSDSLNYLIKQAHDEGHTIALHSMTHNYKKIYSSKEGYFDDLNQISNKVEKITGVKSQIIRFPGGGSNTISKRYSKGIMKILTREVLNKGYHYFDWNIDSGDAGNSKTSDDVYKNVVNNLSKNRANVVLLHDFENNYKTLNALSDIIDYGKANGYKFLAIDMTTAMVRHSVKN